MMRSFPVLLLACGIISCEVISTKNVKLPSSPEKLVVNGVVSNVGVGVYVTKTLPVLQSNPTSSLLEATVSLQKNGMPWAVLQQGADLYMSDSNWKYTDNLTVEVQHPALGKALAVPDPLPSVVKMSDVSAVYTKEKTEAAITLAFRDVSGADYYAYKMIAVKDGVPLTNESIYKIPTDALMSDLSFDNQAKKIVSRLFLLKEAGNNQTIRANQVKVYLYHLSAATYDYYSSLREYDSYNEDTFAEVLPVKNNIQNGYGFVGACSIDTITVNIKQ